MRNRSPMRRLLGVFIALVLAFGITLAIESPASADSQTCLAAPNGMLCTKVYGNKGWVDAIATSRLKLNPFSGQLIGVCDYNAWFFAIHKDGHVESLGTKGNYGCVLGRGWLALDGIHRTFPLGTQMCAKFYENRWNTFVSEKCVGLS